MEAETGDIVELRLLAALRLAEDTPWGDITLSAIAEETGLPVIVAEDPLTCVARGGGKALEMIDQHTFELLSSD